LIKSYLKFNLKTDFSFFRHEAVLQVKLDEVDLKRLFYGMITNGWVIMTTNPEEDLPRKLVESCIECGNEARVRCSESGNPFCNKKCYSKYNE